MIFHRPFLIEQKLNFSTEIDETFLEIRFSPSFVIGQVVEIFNLADLTAYFLTESKKVLKIWGKVIEIDTDKIRIMVMSKLIWTIDEILVTNSEDVFPIFNPSLLGRFWSWKPKINRQFSILKSAIIPKYFLQNTHFLKTVDT